MEFIVQVTTVNGASYEVDLRANLEEIVGMEGHINELEGRHAKQDPALDEAEWTKLILRATKRLTTAHRLRVISDPGEIKFINGLHIVDVSFTIPQKP